MYSTPIFVDEALAWFCYICTTVLNDTEMKVGWFKIGEWFSVRQIFPH